MMITLSIKDRVNLLSAIPQTGKRIEMIIAKSVIDAIGFDINEVGELQIKDTENGRVVWNPAKAYDRDFDFSEEQLHLIKQGLIQLDERCQVMIDMLPLFDKFSI